MYASVRLSESFKGLVSSNGRHRRIVNGTRNGVENDVKQDQKNDKSNPSSFLICAVHCEASFRARFF